jgi:DNA-binding Lrp family transcriptional regulator
MVVPVELGFDVQLLVEKHCTAWTCVPVKHGGHDEATGQLKARPTGKEVVMIVAGAAKTFTTTEINAASEQAGISKQAGSVALHALMREKIVKRIAPMTYALVQLKSKKKSASHPKDRKPARKRASGDDTISAKVIAFVRGHQNGSGEGIRLANIIEELGGEPSSIRSQVAKLASKGKLKRISDGMYRVPAGA